MSNDTFFGMSNGSRYNLQVKKVSPVVSIITSSADDDNYEMYFWAQFAWITVFSIMLIVAIGGNIIVIWIVTAHREMRSVTNYFLVNLSIADLLMSILNCLFNFIYMVLRDWKFGETYCKISNFIATATVAASVFTLTGISCDRYLAIVHPLQPLLSRKKAFSAIICIWLLSVTLGSPFIIYSAIIEYRTKARTRTACILIWPDGLPSTSKYDYGYQIIIIFTMYCIPMFLMIFSYASISRVLWGTHSIGEMTQSQINSIKSKRKIVRMCIIIVIIFGVCWLPYHVYFIYAHYKKEILYSTYVQHLYLGFYWLAMSNAMVNPLIYYWMNVRFRKYFNMCLCGWTKFLLRSATQRGESVETTCPHINTNLQGDPTKINGYINRTHVCKKFRRCSGNPMNTLKTSSTMSDQ